MVPKTKRYKLESFIEHVGVQRKACMLPLLPCDVIKPFVHVIPIPQVCQFFWVAFQEVSFIVKT